MIRTGAKTIPVGSLTLVPIVPFAYIGIKETYGSIHVGDFDVDGKNKPFYVQASPKPEFDNDDPLSVDETAIVSAFWWVVSTSVKADGNMELTSKEVKGVDVPIMRNTTSIPPFTQLKRYVKEVKPPATGTTLVVVPQDKKTKKKGDGASDEPPKKRSK